MGICIGKKIGEYQVIGKKIGSGAESRVYEVKHKGRIFALKYFRSNLCDIQAVKQHINKIYHLESRYVVKIYDHFAYDNSYCMVMERCRTSLQNIYRLLDQATKNQYRRQIIKAVDFLHSIKLFHSDLKLQNILVNQKDRIKLTDFTRSRYLPTNIQTDSVTGTNCYYAPEQHQGYAIGRKADCWALGLILFEMQAKLRVYQLREQCQQPGKIPNFPNKNDFDKIKDKKMKQIISMLLIRDPEKRLTALQAKRMIMGLQTKQSTLIVADTYQNILNCLKQAQKLTTHLTIKHLGCETSTSSYSYLQQISEEIKRLTSLRYFKFQPNQTLTLTSSDHFKCLAQALLTLDLLQQFQLVVERNTGVQKTKWTKKLRERLLKISFKQTQI